MIRNIFFAFVLAGLFFSCSTETTAPQGQKAATDADMIQAIASSPDKLDITFELLPSRSQDILNTDYAESYVDAVMIAPEAGYEVMTRREMGTSVGSSQAVYFDLNGRELNPNGGSPDIRHHDRGGLDLYSCFTVVYPVTFIMPDSSEITGEDGKSICTAIKAWYMAHPDVRERPALQYPVDVILRDSTTLTINNSTELKDLIAGCGESDGDNDGGHHGGMDGGHKACFTLILPVTFIMPDSAEITIADSSDWAALKDWYDAHPDSKQRPLLQYPVDVMLRDSTTMTIQSAEEMRALRKGCKDSYHSGDDDHYGGWRWNRPGHHMSDSRRR